MATVSRFLIGGIVVASLGIIFHIVGLASTDWASIHGHAYGSDYDFTFGLFKACENGICISYSRTASQKAAQAMGILGCLAGAAGVGLAILYTVLAVRGGSPRKIFRLLAGIFCIVAKIFIVICLIVFRAKVYEDSVIDDVDASLGYGFFCTSIGAALFLFGGIMKMAARGYETEQFTS